jgi:hypothetical protein
MPGNQNKIRHYRTSMRMYGEMMQDLSGSEKYISYLIDNDGLDEFETGLRILIEKSLSQ